MQCYGDLRRAQLLVQQGKSKPVDDPGINELDLIDIGGPREVKPTLNRGTPVEGDVA